MPIGQTAWEGFQATEGCTEFFLIEGGGAPWAGDGRPESYAVVAAEQPVTFQTVECDEDDTAVVLRNARTGRRRRR